MILQMFAKEVCHHINCETNGVPGLFWTESSSQFHPDNPLKRKRIQCHPRLQTHTFCMGEIFGQI